MAKKNKKLSFDHLTRSEIIIHVEDLYAIINALKDELKKVKVRCKALEDRLAKNSRNSSKSPSSDMHKPLKKQHKTTSSRKKSGKKPGGQIGHKGSCLEMKKNPDNVVKMPVRQCANCHKSLRKVPADIDRRQVYEIPPIQMLVTEYQSESKQCKHCNHVTKSAFPMGVTTKTQYAPSTLAMMAYLTNRQFIPARRVAEIFETVFGHRVSCGTVINANRYLYERLQSETTALYEEMKKANVAGADETGLKINGIKQWLHTVVTPDMTYYAVHKNRGRKAIDNIGILPELIGTLIHDCWRSYFGYDNVTHALCNAHHIREFRFLYEQQGFQWANEISLLLQHINDQKVLAVKKGRKKFSRKTLAKFALSYDAILEKARKEHVLKCTIDSKNMLKRLMEFKKAVLLFMYDFSVPFTNNTSEQAIRMPKVKQKIMGCFRSIFGAEYFARIYSIVSTALKNGKNVLDVFVMAFQNELSLDYFLKPS